MEMKPAKGGRLIPTPCEAAQAALDYAEMFLRIQREWLVYFGIVKGDDNDSSEPPPDASPDE